MSRYRAFIILLSFSLISISTFAQLEARVINKINEPISFATVVWENQTGLVTNEFGLLKIPNQKLIDSIIVTGIGYKKKIIYKVDFIEKSFIEIQLEDEVITLPEVIAATYSFEKEYGMVSKKSNSYFKNNLCINLQIALLIKNYNYPAKCKSISVFVSSKSSNKIPYRLRLYEIGSDSLPGKDLNRENLIVNTYKINSWNTYQLDTINVQLPKEGFFVAIEWLCTDIKVENGLCIGLKKDDESFTFYKRGNTNWGQLKYNGSVNRDNIMLKLSIATTKN